MGCNFWVVSRLIRVSQVSVPSTGRSGLQPSGCHATLSCTSGFSTLYGSKWVATVKRSDHLRKDRQFQYPLRVEVGCNLVWSRGLRDLLGFQYPLRVEVGCNQPSAFRKDVWLSFSTLYGSKWVATPLNARTSTQVSGFSTLYGSKWVATILPHGVYEPQREFQYPLRVEVGCNLICRRSALGHRMVSVPSTGRSGLQLDHFLAL